MLINIVNLEFNIVENNSKRFLFSYPKILLPSILQAHWPLLKCLNEAFLFCYVILKTKGDLFIWFMRKYESEKNVLSFKVKNNMNSNNE